MLASYVWAGLSENGLGDGVERGLAAHSYFSLVTAATARNERLGTESDQCKRERPPPAGYPK